MFRFILIATWWGCGAPSAEDGGYGGPNVFVQPTLECVLDEEEEVCTWQAIQGCVPEGVRFVDVAECDAVWAQRGYVPGEPYDYISPDAESRLADPVYQAEEDWVKDQVTACGCVCCHSDTEAPAGPSGWSIDGPGLLTDGFSADGLAMMSGWDNSELLMSYPTDDNNGFDRWTTGVPTTDVPRMQSFFADALRQRGFTEADFDPETPAPDFVNVQRVYEPVDCEAGIGVQADGQVLWSGGAARYVYVLDAGAENPLPPPLRDEPEGTLWLVEVHHTDAPVASGDVRYGVPSGTLRQRIPDAGPPPALISGRHYLLYTLSDILLPSTRCLFVAP